MTVQKSEPTSGDANVEDGFAELDLQLSNIEFCAKAELAILEPLMAAEAANIGLQKYPSPISVPLDNIPDLGPVHLLYWDLPDSLHFAAGGMRGKLALQREGGWLLEIRGGGPHPLDEDRLLELEYKARAINEFFFDEDGRVELSNCSLDLYCHNSPDYSDAGGCFIDAFHSFLEGRITRGKEMREPRRIVGSNEKVPMRSFGSASGGRRVSVSVWGGPYQSLVNSEAFAWLEENATYRDDRAVLNVELSFNSPFIRQITRSIRADNTDLNLPGLLRNLVRATLGDGALPHSFFRVATLESQGLPDSLRPNSAPWERVRRAFLDAVRVSGQSTGTEATP